MSEELQSEEQKENTPEAEAPANSNEVKLDGIYAFKMGMSSIYSETGEIIPVTVLKLQPWKVTQIKTQEKDGYNAVQVTYFGKKAHKSSKASLNHFKKSGNEDGAKVCKEVRVKEIPEGTTLGQVVSFDSLQKGDVVKITAKSKGRGFAGAMKRWDFGGGPASHGSSVHRRPGSIGMNTKPGMVMPGKKMPGHFGNETISVRNVKVVDVNPQEGVIMIKGPVPGSRHGLVRLLKQ